MALLIVAVKKGFLEKHGVDPQLKVFDSSPQAVQVLVSGQGDVTMNTEPPHLAARARGGKVVQVMTGWISGRNAAAVVAGNTIARPEDFAGKTIATQRGSGSNYHLVSFLAKHKIPADKVTITYMAAPDQLAAPRATTSTACSPGSRTSRRPRASRTRSCSRARRTTASSSATTSSCARTW